MVIRVSARRQRLRAYHEAGHTIAHALCASGQESVIGATPYSAEDPEGSIDMEIRQQFFCLLAGGIAEQLHTGAAATSEEAADDLRLAVAFATCLEGDTEGAEAFIRRMWIRTRRALRTADVWHRIEDIVASSDAPRRQVGPPATSDVDAPHAPTRARYDTAS